MKTKTPTKPAAEKAHSPFGPSSLERAIECTASVAHSAPFPEQTSEFAQEGTDAHTCFEAFLKKTEPGTAGTLNVKKKLALKFPAEMIDHAHEAYLQVQKLAPKGAIVLSEQKVDISHFTRPGEKGTLDCAIVQEFGRLTIIDFKYGAGVFVPAEENVQLIAYALGLAKEYDFNFAEVELVILQPRCPDENGGIVRKWLVGMEELREAWEDRIREKVEEALDPERATFKAGDHCRFCRGKVTCPEISKQAMAQAQADFSEDFSVQSVPVPTPAIVPYLPTMLSAVDKLETWIDSVRKYALHHLESGGKIEGFKLVAKRSTRKWGDPKAAERAAVKLFGPEVALTDPEIRSPAQLEAAAKIHYTKEAVAKFVKKFSTNVSTGNTIVPASDPRPAVNPILEDFPELPESKPEEKPTLSNKGKKKK